MNSIKSNGIQRNPDNSNRRPIGRLKFTTQSQLGTGNFRQSSLYVQTGMSRTPNEVSLSMPAIRFDVAVYGIIYGVISRVTVESWEWQEIYYSVHNVHKLGGNTEWLHD